MRGIAIAIVLVLLSIECHAQFGPQFGPQTGPQGGPNPGQCEQIRAAIQQHGLQNARKHAMANYNLTPADLRNIEQSCGIGDGDRGRRAKR